MRVGPYTYEVKRNGKESTYSVTDGKETLSFPIVYAFGEGKMGQTYVAAGRQVLRKFGKFLQGVERTGLYYRGASHSAAIT